MQLYDYEREHLDRLRSGLAECAVLLKKNGSFPLNAPCKIAAYGGGVRGTVKGGSGSGEVNSRYFVNVEKGLEDAGFTITTKAWLDGYDKAYQQAGKEFHKEIKARARKKHTLALIEGMGAVMPAPEYELPLTYDAEAAIYVVSRISGEANDRRPVAGDVLLTASEIRDILALDKSFDKFMLVLNVGGVVDLTPVAQVSNVLVLSQLGTETGSALADILLGKSCPSGRLTTTWTGWEDYASIGDFGERDDTDYREGVYVGYRYFDSVGKKPLFPFGYGLGYTDFALSGQKFTMDGEIVTLWVNVANSGKYAGRETLQVYVSSPKGELDKPYQALVGFGKTGQLMPGEEETVEITFRLSELASYNSKREAYVLERGNYILRVGTSSADTEVCGILHLEETAETFRVSNLCSASGFEDWKPEKEPPEEELKDVPVWEVLSKDIPHRSAVYEADEEINDFAKKLTDEELARINIGTLKKGGIQSIIGNASDRVPGAAGESTSSLIEKGLPGMVMADGPAGLRLSPLYYRDKKKVHTFEPTVPASVLEYLPSTLARFLGRTPRVKRGADIQEQYTTAIPIGTAIAQSWNIDFARVCGEIVAEEMERFGVQLWLAPALNIHRNILCGRNFEYFSEDPLLSGKMAAAITRGVEERPGCGVTIKHFAANNQETNRYNNSSNVSERALREIYLKGFEICVREMQPAAVMTSYNLINGVHTAESRGLIQDILRREWGFEGIVMTDWITAGFILSFGAHYAPPHAGRVAAAGSDLFMPGSKKDYKEVLQALRTGVLTRKQLEISATRVQKMALRLTRRNGNEES
ncbi:MAG: glycoside hydrolase family 3 C-terminal domain-containing protein [Lachnospiraceae bacterium]|nr:glycoside hydrolase family 3 C-terminal domain-containing protein [Lachnospiraceae bacterium]